MQVPGDVLQVFGLLAVDVARQVQVVFVALDLLEGHHARVFLDFRALVEDVHDLVDVLGAQAVLGAVLHKSAAGVDHEDAFPRLGMLLVDHDDAGRDARAVEQVGRQADDALDVALAHQGATDVCFRVPTEQHPVRQDAGAFAGALERAYDVQQVGVIALSGRRHAEGFKTVVGIVVRVEPGAPAFIGERRIGDHVIEGLERLANLVFGIGEGVALRNERGGIAVQVHVHARQTAGGRILFLAVQRDGCPRFIPDLEQQRARTAGRVVDGCLRARIRCADARDLRHDAADFGGRVELSLALAALGGEMAHQVFVGIPQNVIPFSAVLGEIQLLFLEDRHQVGQAVHHILAAAQLGRVVEIGEI